VAAGTSTSCTALNRANYRCDADNRLTLNSTAQAMANIRMSKSVGNTLAFPPRQDAYAFRQALEDKYGVQMGRQKAAAYADTEGSVVWLTEYLMYRVHACNHTQAMAKIQMEIEGTGMPPVCGGAQVGAIQFPPRDETFAMRLWLEDYYRTQLKRTPVQTAVNAEGDVVWVSEYIRYRLNGCSHDQAVANVMSEVDGKTAPPVCTSACETTVPILANAPWTDTGIRVTRGQTVRVTATASWGKINTFAVSVPPYGPEGAAGLVTNAPLPTQPWFMLIGRISGGSAFPVGPSLTAVMPADGTLQFAPNTEQASFYWYWGQANVTIKTCW
jgi:hypothetical protein